MVFRLWLKANSFHSNGFIHIFCLYLSQHFTYFIVQFPLAISLQTKTYFLHVKYLLSALFCNCSRWEGKAFQSSASVCYCYSTVHSFHECSPPSSPPLLCKFVPVSQSVPSADQGPHPRVKTCRTGMLSDITVNKHLEIKKTELSVLHFFNIYFKLRPTSIQT